MDHEVKHIADEISRVSPFMWVNSMLAIACIYVINYIPLLIPEYDISWLVYIISGGLVMFLLWFFSNVYKDFQDHKKEMVERVELITENLMNLQTRIELSEKDVQYTAQFIRDELKPMGVMFMEMNVEMGKVEQEKSKKSNNGKRK